MIALVAVYVRPRIVADALVRRFLVGDYGWTIQPWTAKNSGGISTLWEQLEVVADGSNGLLGFRASGTS